MVLDRARQPPPDGYRFPAFAQHCKYLYCKPAGGGKEGSLLPRCAIVAPYRLPGAISNLKRRTRTNLASHTLPRADQDYEPSADHFSVMNTAVNAMLMQQGEDAAGTIVLLPAWPCDVDVSFRLFGSQNTTVEVVWANSTLVSLVVQPPERASAVKLAPCGTRESRELFAISHPLREAPRSA